MGKTTVRLNLTKKSIEAMRARGEKSARFYDTQTRGLGVMVQPTGHRSFFWYRKVRGYPTWRTIGDFPDLSIEQARARAAELNASVARWKAADYDGPAPLEQRREVTLGTALDDYLERHLKAKAKNPDKAVKSARWQFDRYLGSWRGRTLGSIRRSDVRALHADLGENHGRFTANRVFQQLRALFNWALKAELWRGENPARGVAPFHEASRMRFAQPDELPKLFRELSCETNLDIRDFVLIALTTGARKTNILELRWEQLDLKRALWTIPEPKNRVPYIVPLIDETVQVLKDRRRRVQSDWVFPAASASGHVTDVKRAWKKLLSRAKITGLRVHDLRRTLGSWQAGAGVSLPIIGRTLGHQSGDATQVYARLHLDPVREAIGTATSAMLVAGKVPKAKLLRAPRGSTT